MSKRGQITLGKDGKIIFQTPDHELDGKVKWFDASKGYGFIQFDKAAGSANQVKILDYGVGKQSAEDLPGGYTRIIKATPILRVGKEAVMDEVFVHRSAIVGEGYKALREGDKVRFKITGDKGIQAANVVVIPEG